MGVTWHTDTLPNGLRVVTTPMPTTQAVSINLFVGVGSRSEPQRLNGITHFLEHMVFKGTDRRPDALLIAQAIEGAGGTLNAYTNKEFTCYWNIVPFDRFATALDVGADMLLHSKLEQAEIDRERTVVQQELKRNHDNPQAWAARLIGQSVYGAQPCGWDVGGSVETVEEMHRPDFISHIAEWYLPSNIVLSVAGNVQHEQVMEEAAKHFSDMKPGELPRVQAYDPSTTGAQVVTDQRDIDQCTLFLGLPTFGRGDDRRFSMRIMNDLLGGGMSSRLFREVRERRGLAYSVNSSFGFPGRRRRLHHCRRRQQRQAHRDHRTVALGELERLARGCRHRRGAPPRQGPQHRPLPPLARNGLRPRPAPRRAAPHARRSRVHRGPRRPP
ncbi:MAG: pitrilysin family protein [Dehalococcoidia bacterium]|nr:pitrilysin family protein [Dehalococcoidia bacterium]